MRRSVKALFFKSAVAFPNPSDATMTYGDKTAAEDNPGTTEEAGAAYPPRRLPPLRSKGRSHTKDAVEYKMNPESNAMILKQMWENGKTKK